MERTKALFCKAFKIATKFENATNIKLTTAYQTRWRTCCLRLAHCFRCAFDEDLCDHFDNEERSTLWSAMLMVSLRIWWLS